MKLFNKGKRKIQFTKEIVNGRVIGEFLEPGKVKDVPENEALKILRIFKGEVENAGASPEEVLAKDNKTSELQAKLDEALSKITDLENKGVDSSEIEALKAKITELESSDSTSSKKETTNLKRENTNLKKQVESLKIQVSELEEKLTSPQ